MQEKEQSRTTMHQHQRGQRSRKPLGILMVVVVLVCICIIAWIQKGGNKNELEDVSSANTDGNATVQMTTVEGNIPVVSDEYRWMTVLVNSTHALEDGYVPELEVVDDRDFKFDARAAEDLKSMLQDAAAEGLSPMICSSYRSWERQTQLFEKQVEKQQSFGLSYEDAYEEAKTVVAYPGTSEHQTGLAADIVASNHQLLDDSQANTPEQQWLMEHCWKYGFILRYPLGKSEYTGIIYEPWHYRYVGKDVAKYITENDLCLEEYWQQIEGASADTSA